MTEPIAFVPPDVRAEEVVERGDRPARGTRFGTFTRFTHWSKFASPHLRLRPPSVDRCGHLPE